MPDHPSWSFGGGVSRTAATSSFSVSQPGKLGNSVYYRDLVDRGTRSSTARW